MMYKTSGFVWVLLVLAALLAMVVLIPLGKMHPGHELGSFNIGSDYEVVKIKMNSHVPATLTLSLGTGGLWRLNDTLKANDAAVRELLGALRQMVIRMPVPTIRRDSVNLLLEHEGVSIEVFARQYLLRFSDRIQLLPVRRRINRFWVGPDNRELLGTYMKAYRSNNPVIVHLPGIEGGLADLFETNVRVWRDPVVLNLSPHQIRLISVTIPGKPYESFEMTISGAEFIISQAEDKIEKPNFVDTSRVHRFIKSFTELYYQNLLDAHVDSNILSRKESKAFFEIAVQDYSGKNTTLSFFRKIEHSEDAYPTAEDSTFDPNLFFLQINHSELALANYFVFNRIIRQYSFFAYQERN